MHDLTEQVADILTRSQMRAGLVHIFNVGSTAAIGALDQPHHVPPTLTSADTARPPFS